MRMPCPKVAFALMLLAMPSPALTQDIAIEASKAGERAADATPDPMTDAGKAGEQAARKAAQEADRIAAAAEASEQVARQAAREIDQSASDYPDWLSFSEDAQGTVFYILRTDVEKAVAGGTDNRFWVKMDHSKDKTVSARKTMMYFSMDCVQQTTTVLSATTYYANGKRKELGSDLSPQFITPETHMETVAKALCGD